MSNPKPLGRHQLKRCAKLPPGVRRVDRQTRMGNPFPLDDGELPIYRAWVEHSDEPVTLTMASGKTRTFDPIFVREEIARIAADPSITALACWCPVDAGLQCHAGHLIELIQRQQQQQLRLPFEP